MKYILENTDALNKEFLCKVMNMLSLQRQQKIDSLRILSDRINSAAVFLILRYALKKEYGIDALPEFSFGEKGKPYLNGYNNIYFNLSHSRNSCACIISDKETACDISDKRRISDNTARYFCTAEEIANAERSDDKNSALVALWTKKECCSKLSGRGLSVDFKTLTGDILSGINIYDGERYIAAFEGDGDVNIITLDEIFSAIG